MNVSGVVHFKLKNRNEGLKMASYKYNIEMHRDDKTKNIFQLAISNKYLVLACMQKREQHLEKQKSKSPEQIRQCQQGGQTNVRRDKQKFIVNVAKNGWRRLQVEDICRSCILSQGHCKKISRLTCQRQKTERYSQDNMVSSKDVSNTSDVLV